MQLPVAGAPSSVRSEIAHALVRRHPRVVVDEWIAIAAYILSGTEYYSHLKLVPGKCPCVENNLEIVVSNTTNTLCRAVC